MVVKSGKKYSANHDSVEMHSKASLPGSIAKILVLSCCFYGNSYAEGLDNTLNLIRAASDDSWIKMNLNSFSDAWVPQALRPLYGTSYADPSRVIDAWSSFAWDSNRGQLLIFGGGHANYAGNEVYSWNASTQMWGRESLPSALDSNLIPVAGTGVSPLGGAGFAPQSSHTYDNSVFLPIADRFVTFGGAAFQSGGPFVSLNSDGSFSRTGPYFFDPSKADPNKVGGADGSGVDPSTPGGYMWDNRNSYANLAPGVFLPGSVTGTTDYANINGKEVIFTSGPAGGGTEHMLASLTINDYNDPTQDVWQVLGINWYGSGRQGAGAYDPVNNLYIKTFEGATPFTFWNLDTAGPFNKNVLVNLASAPADFDMHYQYGLEYDPVRHGFLMWGGGSSVFELNVGNKDETNWTVTKVATIDTGLIPNADVTSGVLGKWHYASDLDVFVGLEGSVDGNVWFFKPTGWVDPAAAVPIPGAAYLMLSGLSFMLSAGYRKERAKAYANNLLAAYSS